MSEFPGAVPFVTIVTVVVVVTTVNGSFPTTIPVVAMVAEHTGAVAHVPLKVITNPDAGDPAAPIVTRISESLPATEGDVPQFDEHVGGVVCVEEI